MQFLPEAITPLQPVTLNPTPTGVPNPADGECGRALHQRWDELYATPRQYPPEHYELSAKENPAWVFNPAYPPQRIWGFAIGEGAATTPGPTIMTRYGKPVIVRFKNRLPQNHVGFGSPEISMHLHNAHTGSESDGYPGDYFSPIKAGPTLAGPGQWKDHFYPNIYAGYDQMQNGIGDEREALATLWYHDHTFDFTAPNLYLGMAGFYLLYDHIDSGNERDPDPRALRLPSHPYDYPLSFGDRRFDASGRLIYDQVEPDGTLGDKIVVNGKIEPVLKVAARKYRFRLLDIGPSRIYEFYLQRANGVSLTFTHIGNDGNLFAAPLKNTVNVHIAVAERADIVIDFSQYPIGTELYLVNRLVQTRSRQPDGLGAATRVLKFVVDRHPPEQDLSQVPNVLRAQPPLDLAEIAAAPVRRWVFERKNGMWAINGQFFNPNSARAVIPKGGAEVWELVNIDNGWDHPIHIHFEEGRIISKTQNGVAVPVPPYEQGRKDVYLLKGQSTIRVFIRFRDYVGKYVMHCHNLIHEDHAMMLRWDIKDDN
ncbi:multicopper oxidase domain-containing protein [Pseudomonas sp. sp1636]|uniref:multicopper oxidase family protein n=1 Tax=Pseudomonas sp. sp1636 TaxID=3036707 RepID=UPI0025A56A1A|nr:multicopper oxidase domain-containing protein [Pseudomonas sp. sp1636]MDM8349663.1 multicopper oxidase domain-containing protein [Pseudomonas sp. sp1636]